MIRIDDQESFLYFAETGEHDYVTSFNMIVDRYVLPIQEGVYIYDYPEYVYNIRRVTYMGRKLDPFSGREHIWSDSTPGSYSSGEPREYIYNYYGKKQIRLFPTPSITLPTNLDPWTGDGIKQQMVMSFYRSPSTEDDLFRMPYEIRDQFIDNYIIKEVSKMDAENFDTKSIQFFESLYQQDREDMTQIFTENIFRAIIPTRNPTEFPCSGKPGRPQLPWNFGINNRS